MQKLKTFYLKNSIAQFLVSYILVMIIPMAVLSYGFQNAFQVVEQDIKESNLIMLSQSMSLINEEAKALESLALQSSQTASLRDFAAMTVQNGDYIMAGKKAMDEFYKLLRYQNITLLGDAYIYLDNLDLVIYNATIYQPDIFRHYVAQWGMTMEEWYALCKNNRERTPSYTIGPDGVIQYIMPFSNSPYGENLGVIVYRYDSRELTRLLQFVRDYSDYSIFILDDKNQIFYSEDLLEHAGQLYELPLDTPGFHKLNSHYLVYSVSQRLRWKYILILPDKVALKQLTILKTLVTVLICSASAIGVLCSLFLAIRKGKPINEIFHAIGPLGDLPYNPANLGTLVASISKNHQNLLEELEQDKPMLQKAFFHDLIKAEFITTKELFYNAKRAGITLSGSTYQAAAVKLFPDNDFYTIDEQTMEEVRLLTGLLHKQIIEASREPVWVYKKNYLTSLLIFQTEGNSAKLLPLIEQTCHLLLTEYQVESFFGISSLCLNLLDIWKSCEEAITAMEHCHSEKHIQLYDSTLENQAVLYFPEIAEEKLAASLTSGEYSSAETILSILETENFKNRSLNRQNFIKFNRKITDILNSLDFPGVTEKILWLNEEAINYAGIQEMYFTRLRTVCRQICGQIHKNKYVRHEQLIERIMAYIQENYMDSSLGLAKISSEFRISEGYVSSVFKEQSHINFADYVEGIRIERACALLKKNSCTINEISAFVGYNSVQSFRRAFKRVKGASPKEWR